MIDDEVSLKPHLLKLGQHFAALNDLRSAEKFYVKGGMYKEAIEMYNQAGLCKFVFIIQGRNVHIK